MKKIDLVFRSVGERTAEASLDLAIKQIQPDRVHILNNVKPFAKAVQQMLAIDYDCDFVIAVDADCLIMEDMIPFLEQNNFPYLDCYVLDKFRGNIHCGVHITRIDVIRAMAEIPVPKDDAKYVLRPESRLRALALREMNLGKIFKPFKIFHDFFQYYREIFAKYALRELRSRTEYHQQKLNFHQEEWQLQGDDLDFKVANYAVEYARKIVASNASPQEMARFIENLPEIAIRELEKQNISEKEPFSLQEAWDLIANFNSQQRFSSKTMKVFGIGMANTENASLTMALNQLGIHVLHSLNEEIILKELMAGKYNLSIFNEFDGITATAVAPFFPQLDQMFPDSKFILTVRDRESWLKSVEETWQIKDIRDGLDNEPKNQIRILQRVAIFGTYKFNRERLSYIYDLHYKTVMEYFKDRPESLLIIDICGGEGWEKLCPFFKSPLVDAPFPFKSKD
ncbi:sulfotransferase family protein [Limnofasciculus baicalensis]|uniref:Uncharacterized protein n=1 Tax=Limnofasciculus baicalensis BBK-W-15 TaxID=2699891 RepID=A0AAE3KPN2_9CYAN|nr:sulfotransferase family protein [Limnofasciculus baicalensis]MCP2729838.1 hypothetical protein [Limnofasciculus baicalensis BBK-W-15]